MERTLKILQNYSGEYEATLLVNCLLGLLVIPKEVFRTQLPSDSLTKLSEWGINPSSIKCVGNPTDDNSKPSTIRGLVNNLRHSVAHFDVTPKSDGENVDAFVFKNRSGFHAEITLQEMRDFVRKLTASLA